MSKLSVPKFCIVLKKFSVKYARSDLLWRQKKYLKPYSIIVSEIMLQQTQVSRVQIFFERWMKLFPDVTTLACASVPDVLRAWQGLGYNNRALRLQKMAQIVGGDGKFPKTVEELEKFPGIGPYTAGAVSAFVHNKWNLIIETNIRRIMLHHFFHHTENVSDAELFKKILAVTLYIQKHNIFDARNFYWAMMDYGSHLGSSLKKNPNQRSKHYTKQSRFTGSVREVRANIVKLLLESNNLQMEVLSDLLCISSSDDIRISKALSGLQRDCIISINSSNIVSLTH